MGPNNPWSPDWRPDESGARLRRIYVARRGAAVAGLLWIPVSLVAARQANLPLDLGLLTVAVGSAGVALLGAGLAPAAIGSRIDAVVVGVAMALGAPIASVISLLITGAIIDALASSIEDLVIDILRSSVRAGVGVTPLVLLAVVGWVVIVRRYARRLGVKE